ncbi:MAG: sulfopyruvate decarboxylase subunit beta, partial [Methanothrix soehngenii]|nr:sulfopyruvate decarboxylase subunit beta [Methanothrix soehngenii]
IALHGPKNFLLVILDNCCYGSTGSQPTCTCYCTDLAAVARGAGIREVENVDDIEGLAQVLEGQGVVVAKVETGNAIVPIIDLGPEQIIERFTRSALSAEPS